MHTLGLILARAGSKGLVGKNERVLAGKPCIEWTIDFARTQRRLDRVAVSTDGSTLRAIAERCGVDVLDRPEQLATDSARVDSCARDALLKAEHACGGRYDAVLLLYANVPVRPDDLGDRAMELLERSGADSVQSYGRVGKHHPLWTAVVDEAGGGVRPWQGERLNGGVYRRQDLPPAHVPDGGVLAVRREALMLELEGVEDGPHRFLGADRRGIVTQAGAVVDIDCEMDAIVAEVMLSRRLGGGEVAA